MRSSSIRAPVARCGSNGTSTTTAAPRLEVAPHPVGVDVLAGAVAGEHEHRVGHALGVAVHDQPVQGLVRPARAVRRGRADDHEAVGQRKRPADRGVHEAAPRVGDHHVVEAAEHLADALVPGAVKSLAHRRVLLRGEHLQPACEAGVAGHVGEGGKRLDLPEHVPHRRGGVAGEPVRERAGVRAGVQRHHPVAPVLGQHQPDARRHRGLPDATVDRGDADLVGAAERPSDALHLVALRVLLGTHARVEHPAARGEQGTAPAGLRAVDAPADNGVGGQVPRVGAILRAGHQLAIRARALRAHQFNPQATDDRR